MGLFSAFKRKKDTVLQLPEQSSTGFIQPLASSLIEVKLGQKLIVNEGWCAVIVVKDKPTDVFSAGEHDLTLPMIPKTTRALKLDKSRVVKRKGKQEVVFKSSFKCDLYFVNMRPISNQPWMTGNIIKGNKKVGRYPVSISGLCTYESTSAGDTVRLFLLEWAKIATGKAQERLNQYISEFATSALEWSRENDPEVLNNKARVAEIVLPSITKNLEKYGIKIDEFAVEKVDFGRAVSAILAQQQRDSTIEPQPEMDADEIVKNIDFEEVKEPVVIDVSNGKTETETVKSENTLDLTTLEPEPEKVHKIEDDLEPIDFTKLSDEELLKKQIRIKKKHKEPRKPIPLEPETPKTTEPEPAEKLGENEKKCPNCGKIHDKNDQICDCGCILE